MAIIKLKCPDCAETFKWPAQDNWPKFCPYCRADVSQGDDSVISMPFISSAKAKSPDAVYRAMENGANHRAAVAAEMTGQPVSEFSDLKITDMKDNLREGDTANIGISPDNEVAKVMAQNPQQFGNIAAPNFAARDALIAQSAGVATGPFANAGAKMQNMIRQQHSKYVPQGQSDLPALETQSPLYRRRS